MRSSLTENRFSMIHVFCLLQYMPSENKYIDTIAENHKVIRKYQNEEGLKGED